MLSVYHAQPILVAAVAGAILVMTSACSDDQIEISNPEWSEDGRMCEVRFDIENLSHSDLDLCLLVDLSLRSRSTGAKRGPRYGHAIEVPVHLDPKQTKSISHETELPGLGSVTNMRVVQVRCSG